MGFVAPCQKVFFEFKITSDLASKVFTGKMLIAIASFQDL